MSRLPYRSQPDLVDRETFTTVDRPSVRPVAPLVLAAGPPYPFMGVFFLNLPPLLFPFFAAIYPCASYNSFTACSVPNLALHRGRLAPLTSVPLFNFCIPTCSLRPWRPTPLPWKPWLCAFDRRRPPRHGDAMAVLQAAAIVEPCLLHTPEVPMHHRRRFLLQPTV